MGRIPADLPHFRPMLAWLRDPRGVQVEETDFVLVGVAPASKDAPPPLPDYLKCPLELAVASPTIRSLERPIVLRLAASAPPHEMYAVGFRFKSDDGGSAVEAAPPCERAVELILVEPAFTALFLKYHVKRASTGNSLACLTPKRVKAPPGSASRSASQPVAAAAALRDASISLGSWVPSQEPVTTPPAASQPAPNHPDGIRAANKNMLKKLLLLSLRHVGIDKHHREFASIWKHLYCGCLFALRGELGGVRIEQAEMLSTIRSNMNFLNIK